MSVKRHLHKHIPKYALFCRQQQSMHSITQNPTKFRKSRDFRCHLKCGSGCGGGGDTMFVKCHFDHRKIKAKPNSIKIERKNAKRNKMMFCVRQHKNIFGILCEIAAETAS